jgi:hypothetical protein
MYDVHPIVQDSNARGHGTVAWRWIRDALLSESTPDASVFLRHGERIGVADLDILRHALILRALYARRTAVRRCIARVQLEQMRSALGGDTFEALVEWSASDGETTLLLPENLTPLALAQDGLWRLRSEGTLRSMAITQLIQCRLGALSSDVPQVVAADDPPSAAESERFIVRLSSLLPAVS